VTATLVSSSGEYEVVSILADCSSTSAGLACDDSPGTATTTRNLTGSASGTTYMVVADNYGSDDGPFTLTVSLADPVPAPPGDVCSAPEEITATVPGTQSFSGDTTMANNDYSGGSCDSDGNDVFYHLHLATEAHLTATVTSSDFDPYMTLALLPSCGGTELTCANDASETATLDVTDLPAGDYILVVDSDGYAEAPFTLDVTLDVAIPPPANDVCSGAVELSVHQPGDPDAVETGDSSAATNDFHASCGGQGGDTFYTLNLTSRAAVTATVAAQGSSSRYEDVSIVADCTAAASSTSLVCADHAGSATVTQVLNAGTYLVVADNNSGSDGPYTLTVSVTDAPLAPSNDSCASGTIPELTVGSPVTGDTSQAANDFSSALSCFKAVGSTGLDVVYAFTPPGDDSYDITVTPQSGFDVVAYMLDSCADGQATSCVGGADNGASGTPERLRASLTAAHGPYYIVVDGYSATAKGTFTIDVEPTPPPPANDSCGGNIPALAIGNPVTGDTTDAADDFSSTSSCFSSYGSGAPDLVYAFTPLSDGPYDITVTPQSGYNTVLYVLGSTCSGGAASACVGGSNSGSSTGSADKLRVNLTAADGPYYVVVDGSSSTQKGTFTLDVEPTPAGDICSAPLPLTDSGNGDFTATGDNTSYANDFSATCGGSGNDIFYALHLDADASVVATVTPNASGSTFEPVVSVLEVCSATNSLKCNDSGSGGAAASVTMRSLAGPGDYVIAVDGYASTHGGFDLTVHVDAPLAAPAGDQCASPIALSATPLAVGADVTVTGSTADTANDLDDTSCYDTTGGDVFYQLDLAAESKVAITASTSSSVYMNATLLSACGTAGLACKDGYKTATVTQNDLQAGTYFIAVDGDSGDEGNYQLHVTVSAPVLPPTNDTCATAVDLTGAPNWTVSGDTTDATNDYTTSSSSSAGCTGYSNTGPDLAYSFTPAAGGSYTFKLTPSSGDLALYVLDTCPTGQVSSCLGGSDRASSGGAESVTLTLTANTPYLVFVDGYSASSAGTFTLSVTGP